MSHSDLRIGLIGAGYIAGWHAQAVAATEGMRVAAICDAAPEAGEALANALGVPYFRSLAEMASSVDAVHILTPPASHAPLAVEAFGLGLHVLVEKPVALTRDEMTTIRTAADTAGRQLVVSHNFLGIPAFQRLKALVAQGALGRLSSLQVDWALPLAPLRSGPYGLWLLREERNLLLEIGPHPMGFVSDLLGDPEILAVHRSHPVILPGGAGERHQGWRILAQAGGVDVTLQISMVETVDDRSVTLRGSSGRARLNFAADTLIVDYDNTADIIVNPLLREVTLAGRHLGEGLRNAVRQAASLNRKSPYGLSFQATVAAFRDAIRSGRADHRLGGVAAEKVMTALFDTLDMVPAQPVVVQPKVETIKPADVMVIGGTGYIGRALVRTLVARGHVVRVLSRGGYGPFGDIADQVETVPVSLSDEAGLTEAMRGMEAVYNLARAMEKSWDAALANDVGAALRVARAAHAAGVGRLIYTGTIASFDMSDPLQRITEDTAFGPMEARNLYARSKAECEKQLRDYADQVGLDLAIARPGIVIGGDGPLQHWGIGRWHGAGAVKLWGNGKNKIPFVLVDDVAEGLVRLMEVPAAGGGSFNLVGDNLVSARDYFEGIRARTGARIHVSNGSLTGMWAMDAVKWALKRYGLRKADAVRPSLADWKSRGHLAPFDNSQTKAQLDWQPEANAARMLDRAIDAKALFGL